MYTLNTFSMPQGTFDMAGFQNQQPSTVPVAPVMSGPQVQMPPVSAPMLQAHPMDQLTAFVKPKPHKEGGAAVQFAI